MPAPLAIGSAILGGIQLFGGLATAMGMGDRPQYTMTPEMRRSAGRAEYMAGMGFLPEERASAQQEAASTQMAGFRQAQDMGGGNLARSMGGSMAASNLGFQNRMAAQDAGLRRQNIRYADTFSREAQRLSDANTAADLNFRMQEERAVGQAMQSGFMNLANFGNLQAAMGYNPSGGTVPEGGYQVPSGMFGTTSQYPDEMWATGGMPGENVQTAITTPSFTTSSPFPSDMGEQSIDRVPQYLRRNQPVQQNSFLDPNSFLGMFYGNSMIPNLY
jgi:hypothetical protein